MNMDSQTLEQLRRFYSNLKNQLILKKKLKENSVLFSIINVKSNESYKLLSESGIEKVSISQSIFDTLEFNEMIRMAEVPEKYVITVKGIWEIELTNGYINTNILLQMLDKKFFDLFKEEGQLTEKEKVILFAMISVRAFSSESALDLKKGETVLNCLQELLQESYELLSRNNVIIKLKASDLFGAPGTEHPVSNLIRHTDALLKRTAGKFMTLGRQRYYLALFDQYKISETGLASLFGLIFGSQMTPLMKQEISNFCQKNAYYLSTYLFDFSVHQLANPVYDEQFNEALEKYFASKYKWDSNKK